MFHQPSINESQIEDQEYWRLTALSERSLRKSVVRFGAAALYGIVNVISISSEPQTTGRIVAEAFIGIGTGIHAWKGLDHLSGWENLGNKARQYVPSDQHPIYDWMSDEAHSEQQGPQQES